MAGIGADDMGADHLLGLVVLEDLHEAGGHGHGARARIGGERELASLVGDARGLQLFLGLADGGDFRPGVDHARNGVVVDMRLLAELLASTTPSSSARSEEHTSELQSLMPIPYSVFCLKKKNQNN